MTKRPGLLLGTLVVFAACGGGGGNNNDTKCGNGLVEGNETCDDGNTSSGDGCSATCKTESAGSCGDGTVDVGKGEQCDDNNTTSGDGCSATCQNEIPAGCGDGTVAAGEECDDHNNVSGDGCSSTCHLETAAGSGTCAAPFTVTFVDDTASGGKVGHAMGDTTTSTNQVAEGTCSGESAAGGGKDHQFKIVLATRSDLEISNVDADEVDPDLILRLSSTVCDMGTEIADNAGHDGCSDDDPEFLGYRGLPAGTYFLDVDGYSDTDGGMYDVKIDVLPTVCGNGMLDPGEQCDDGDADSLDGCSSRCLIETGYVCNDEEPSVCALNTCGDGTIGGTEECDDLNLVNGDGCDSMCKLESDVLEVEPNDTTPQVLTAGSHRIKGSLSVGDDVDFYTFTIPAGGAHVEIETYTTIEANRAYSGNGDDRYDCEGNADTGLALFDSAGDLTDLGTALVFDSDDGDLNDGPDGFGCSYIGTNDTDGETTQGDLVAGTYTIEVGEEGGNALGRYLIAINVTAGTPPPPVTGLVINEYMANDSDADTNCDGVHGTGTNADTNDEFVEIVNKGTTSVDLTGMTISDKVTVRHTFKATDTTGSMTLAPGKAVVVWGGGAPACPGVTNWFVANSAQHTLALNNTGGDTITLKTGGTSPMILATASYTANPTAGVSANLNPDITGTAYVLHNAVTGHVGSFSPGKKSDGTAF